MPEDQLLVCEDRWGSRSAFVTQIQQPFFADGADARLLNFCSITGLRFYNKIIDYVKYLNNISE